MSKNEFVQLAGCADGWMINRAGVVKSANGKTLIVSPVGNVTVKLVNGNNRAVKVSELLKRNFGVFRPPVVGTIEPSEFAEVVSEAIQESEAVAANYLMNFSTRFLEAELERRKSLCIENIAKMLDQAKLEYGSDVVDVAIAKFAGI